MKPDGYLPIAVAAVLGAVPARAATVRISMQDLIFAPAAVGAKVGDTVEWVNEDIFTHTATARNADWDVTLLPNKTVRLVLKGRERSTTTAASIPT